MQLRRINFLSFLNFPRTHNLISATFCRGHNIDIKDVNKNDLYIQGQSPEKNIREYFYYIDHQGMLFLDDSKMKNFTSCFKEKKFLAFFFKRLRLNETGRYMNDFPYVSMCGRERNFIRCDDRPIVYTHVSKSDSHNEIFCYGHAGDSLHNPFDPKRVTMCPETGRVYHPCHAAAGTVGLVQSKLAIEFSKKFRFDNGESQPPTHFEWNGTLYTLDQDWMKTEQ